MDVVDRWWMGVGGLMVDRVGAERQKFLAYLLYKWSDEWTMVKLISLGSVIALVSNSG